MSDLTAQEMIYKNMIQCVIEIHDDIARFVYDYGSHDSYCDLWYELKDKFNSKTDVLYNVEYETREGMETNLRPKTSSRYYEIDVHAIEVDGIWVAWDFYYGGGKHGEPEAFDWISNARIVECEEKVVTKVEYRFKEIAQ